jgi:putative Holliday junction resolvase
VTDGALLGVDLGERRIGVAIVSAGDVSARPLVTLPRRPTTDADATALAELVRRHAVTELIVGLPLEAAGGEGPQAGLTRTWVEAVRPALEATLGAAMPAIAFRDERLSSHLAETRLGPMRRGRSGGPPTKTQRDAYRSQVDREAAAIILQDELDARRAQRASSTDPQPDSETSA